MIQVHSFIRKIKNLAHLIIAYIAITYYRNPSKKLEIIGVTGTDGKTTTSNYIYQLLEMSGKKAALISTVGFFMRGEKKSLGLHVTTPSPFALNKYLSIAAINKIQYLVLEVSSHAIDQHRIYGIDFEVSTITNVTKEHLDYHKNIENYLNTKIKLLQMSKNVVLNNEDPFLTKIKEKIKDKKIFTYSLNNNKSDLKYISIKSQATEKLTDYNKKNLMVALLTLNILGINLDYIDSKIEKLELPEGRLHYLKETPFKVVIDFAHTPNAFLSLLPEVKKDTQGNLIHVFGSAGKRDKSKRPDMGKISSEYSDIIILTSEDTRGENIHKINSDIRRGMKKDFSLLSNLDIKSIKDLSKKIVQIDDRKEAIKFAIKIAKPNDTVLVTGKGPEDSMNLGGKEIPWNDIEITKKLLN